MPTSGRRIIPQEAIINNAHTLRKAIVFETSLAPAAI